MIMKNSKLPAFPVDGLDYDVNGLIVNPNHGLTKREYFLAMAMQGLLASGISERHDSIAISNKASVFADAVLNKS